MRRNTQGFTLIEVLVALVVVAIGLIGMAGINAAAVKYTKGAEGRSHASELAYDIVDRIRASRDSLTRGGYASANAPAPTICQRARAAVSAIRDTEDIAAWRNQVACLLPRGEGQISIGGVDATTGLYPVTVTIQWDESRIDRGSQPAYSFVVRTQI
jgi:type IV pilus assembly protein PilV